MTQEEFYIWLMDYDPNLKTNLFELGGGNSEFLKNYEIAKLVLDKFGIHWLSENQQRKLNLEAVSAWFRISKCIKLDYDIPEILELLPEKIVGNLNLEYSKIETLPEINSVEGDLDLSYSQVQHLPKLKSVGKNFNLQYSQIEYLPKLESVGGYLNLEYSQIEYLPELKFIEKWLDLSFSQIQFLPKLESAGKSIYASYMDVDYWKKYFRETGRTDLADKVCQ